MTTTTRVAVSAGLALAIWLTAAAIQAQTQSAAAETKALYETIAGLDAVLFDGFNTCDLDKFGNLLVEDVEFFHDKTGLMLTRKAVVASVKDNICGKVRRELVSGTLEVYPIPGYGAIEAGSHRFYEIAGGQDKAVGIGRFLHIWNQSNGQWKITRIVSYDHKGVDER